MLAKIAARNNNFIIYSAICLIGFGLYFKSLFFGFTYLDDNELVLNNLRFLQNPWYVFSAFFEDVFHTSFNSASYYRPLLTISFIPEAILTGANSFLYHAANMLIHIGAACLAFKIFLKLNYSKTISIILGIIFLVHPTLAQAVSWIPGRNDSLLGFFIFASFILFLNFIEKKGIKFLVWHSIFFAFAIFTKETALVFPVLCLAYLWAKELLSKNIIIRLSACWLVAILIWFILRYIGLNGQGAISAQEATFSVIKNMPASIQLLGKAFMPFNLSVLPIMQDTTFVYGFFSATIMALLAGLEIKNRQKPNDNLRMMLFGALWFALFLLPAFIKAPSSNPADFIEHRLYVPIIGLFIIIAQSRIIKFIEINYRNWLLYSGVIIIIGFLTINFLHQNNFKNKMSFWQNAADNSPHSPLAQKNLGAMHYLEGNYYLSEKYSKKALEINPYETMAHNNLGLVYARAGRFEDAEKEYLKELSFNYSYDGGHYNLGLLYYRMGYVDEAKKEWEKTLEINPDYKDARIMLDSLNKK